jgi:peptidoglycan/xylan/chitin deacetylase (PgdA/CDA1 family)
MRFHVAKGRPRCRGTAALLWAGLALAGLYGAMPANGAKAEAPVYVLFTIDVETRIATAGNVEQDVWGILPGEPERHGIERMMDCFDKYGAKAVFFVNVYEEPLHPKDAVREVCRRIQSRGHEVGLHTHPAPLFGISYMQYADLQTQVKILKAGVARIEDWTGERVYSHRAGGNMANLDTIRACAQAGIPVDSSYNAAWPASALSTSGLTLNAPIVSETVLCLPDTCYAQVSLGNWQSLRHLDIESSSPEETRTVVRELREHNVRAAVIMLHSFSFVRFGKPNLRVERALEDLVAGFAADPGVRIVTARQLYEIWRSDPGALAGADYLPTTGWWMMYCRAWQRLDEGWKNVAVAFGPPVLLAVLGTCSGVMLNRRRRRRARAAL